MNARDIIKLAAQLYIYDALKKKITILTNIQKVDILPTAKAGGFWDVNGICLLNAGLTLPLPIELMPQL